MTDEYLLDEQIVLGAAMSAPEMADQLLAQLDERDFGEGKHRALWSAIFTVRDGRLPATYPAVAEQLMAAGILERVGGVPYLLECSQALPTGDVAGFHATRVADAASLRRQRSDATRHLQILKVEDPEERAKLLATLGAEILAEVDRRPGVVREVEASLLLDGGDFLLDGTDAVTAVWGDGSDVLWAEGEALMICGPSGVGKTTIALQVLRARLGLQDKVLGHSVRQTGGKVLYLAMDRPAQWKRAARRIFTEHERAILNERLVVWKGPPPKDFAADTGALLRLCNEAGADTVVIDSIKDAAIGLAKDEVGAGYNQARQLALAAGVEVLELHHLRKSSADNKRPDKLDDIYGSTWITAGAGSVVLLWGEAGDPVVDLRHLKQPESELGPFKVAHDHDTGVSEVEEGVDLKALVTRTGVRGLTAYDCAVQLFSVTKPSDAQKKKAMRLLNRKVNDGFLTRRDGAAGGDASHYFLRHA